MPKRKRHMSTMRKIVKSIITPKIAGLWQEAERSIKQQKNRQKRSTLLNAKYAIRLCVYIFKVCFTEKSS